MSTHAHALGAEIVTNLIRHFRGPLIAIVALTMSAGLAYAAHPAADRQNNVVTQGNSSETAEPDESESPDASETPDSSESPDSNSSAGDNCATDPTGLTSDQLAAMSHGSIVCWAAHQDTPEGWDNHGAWVSHWAQMNKGSAASSASKGKGHSPKQ
jgi:hypothetical protein